MILEYLIVYSLNNENIVKQYKFNEFGLNIILGNKSDGGNGAGKTSMVQSLNYLLGSKIPNDFEKRERLLNENIMLVLEVSKDNNKYYLGRIISEKNSGFFKEAGDLNFNLDNWEVLKDKDYKAKIEELFMEKESENTPSFAALREYICRDEKIGFGKLTLPMRSAIKTHEIISYLFQIYIDAESKIYKLKENQEELEKKLKLIESMSEDIIDVRIKEKKVSDEVKVLLDISKSINIKGSINIEKNEYANLKNEFNEVCSKLIKLENTREQYQISIEKLKCNVDKIKELDDVEEFFLQILEYFPEKISKNKEEVLQYYNFMVNSRGRYFLERIEKLDKMINSLETKKVVLEGKLDKRVSALRSTTIVNDINNILDKINEKNQELADLRFKIEQYSKRDEIINDINCFKEKIIRETHDQYELYTKFNTIIKESEDNFNEIVKETYNEDGVLQFEFNRGTNKRDTTGRVKIECSIIDETSHGRSYMKINMFDICWLVQRIRHNKSINLLIHDGSYVKPDDKMAKYNLIKYVDRIMGEYKRGQYFITLNRDELYSHDIEDLDNTGKVIAYLDKDIDENRFMGMRYV